MPKRSTRVLVLYNEPLLPKDHPDALSEHDILDTVDDVCNVLKDAGFAVDRLGVGRDPMALIRGVKKARPDAVFNLFEGLADWGETEACAAGVLEWLGVPFTGCPVQPITLARNKPLSKYVLLGAGLATPRFQLVESLPMPANSLGWPVIVKPSNQDASVGITQASVVTEQAALEARVAEMLQAFGPPVLVEEFIAGRELHVNAVEELDGSLTVLPAMEVVFGNRRPGVWPVYSFDAKWREDSVEYKSTPLETAVKLPPGTTAEIADLTVRVYRLFGCRDFARIDVRLTTDGRPSVLEVNPNPFINSIAMSDGFIAIGRKHEQFVADLVRRAILRGGAPQAAPLRKPRVKKTGA
ncbi:MAG: hypothetical protein U0746_15265 [Gemmataceae bacterium]